MIQTDGGGGAATTPSAWTSSTVTYNIPSDPTASINTGDLRAAASALRAGASQLEAAQQAAYASLSDIEAQWQGQAATTLTTDVWPVLKDALTQGEQLANRAATVFDKVASQLDEQRAKITHEHEIIAALAGVSIIAAFTVVGLAVDAASDGAVIAAATTAIELAGDAMTSAIASAVAEIGEITEAISLIGSGLAAMGDVGVVGGLQIAASGVWALADTAAAGPLASAITFGLVGHGFRTATGSSLKSLLGSGAGGSVDPEP